MKHTLLFGVLILFVSIMYSMDFVTYTTVKYTPNRFEQELSQKQIEFVDLHEEIYNLVSQNKKEQALKMVPNSSINSLFIYGINKNNAHFITWLLSTETTQVHFYPLTTVLTYARLSPHSEIIKLIEDHIKYQEATPRKVIIEKNEKPECQCIIL